MKLSSYCQECETADVKLVHPHDDYWCSCDERVCESCRDDMGEAAEQARISDYYGGSGPQTLDEQHRAAWLQKRSL